MTPVGKLALIKTFDKSELLKAMNFAIIPAILNTSLPSIAKDLNESPLNMQNAIISYVLTLALFMPVSGFLADKFGFCL